MLFYKYRVIWAGGASDWKTVVVPNYVNSNSMFYDYIERQGNENMSSEHFRRLDIKRVRKPDVALILGEITQQLLSVIEHKRNIRDLKAMIKSKQYRKRRLTAKEKSLNRATDAISE